MYENINEKLYRNSNLIRKKLIQEVIKTLLTLHNVTIQLLHLSSEVYKIKIA